MYLCDFVFGTLISCNFNKNTQLEWFVLDLALICAIYIYISKPHAPHLGCLQQPCHLKLAPLTLTTRVEAGNGKRDRASFGQWNSTYANRHYP